MSLNLSTSIAIIKAIVDQQEIIMGPYAREKANEVEGLIVGPSGTVTVNGDPEKILKNLIDSYYSLFGDVSVQVCKDSVKQLIGTIDSNQIPVFLK